MQQCCSVLCRWPALTAAVPPQRSSILSYCCIPPVLSRINTGFLAPVCSPSFTLLQSKYYSEKLGIHKHDAAARRSVAASFIEGLLWVLEYYYRGVASWTWFFPHHFAPMISDMVEIQEFEVAFQLGQPFLPFQQLLGVLPSASFKLLPEPYQVHMSSQSYLCMLPVR